MIARPRDCAFTLIELLVVVAIIAILAAIALPNFLAAQTRAKVARAQADMRSLTTAIEAYRVDFNAYPPASGVGPHNFAPNWCHPVRWRLIPLTTPIAFITAVPSDPFRPRNNPTDFGQPRYDTYDYVDVPNPSGNGSGVTSGAIWRLVTAGPDLYLAYAGVAANGIVELNERGVDYDPTNGTVSEGDVVRVGSIAAPTGNGGAPDDLSNPERPGILRIPSYREQWQ